MIARIQGRLHFKSPEHLIIDLNGLGYQIQVPLSTFYELPDAGSTVALHIHTHVREDALQLYGFQSREEKQLFVQLIGISGIGPRLAVNILSGITPADFAETIYQGDLARLVSIPGVGRKTAERMMVEMRDKLPALALGQEVAEPMEVAASDAIVEDALSALANLGYKKGVAQRAIKEAQGRIRGEVNLENLLKESLRSLA